MSQDDLPNPESGFVLPQHRQPLIALALGNPAGAPHPVRALAPQPRVARVERLEPRSGTF